MTGIWTVARAWPCAQIPGKAKRFFRWAGWAAMAVIVLVAVVLLWPMDTTVYLCTNPSPMLLDRGGEPLNVYLNAQEEWCLDVRLEDVSPHLVNATLAAEDQRFWHHSGVDTIAVARALFQNLRAGHTVSGASTLTMQIAKMGWPGLRTRPGKAGQAITAWRLECRANKHDILQAYLGRANYGANLIGCESAARRYFGKTARELTIPEAALLAGLPKAPAALSPTRHRAKAQNRRDYVLRRMRDEHYISEAEYESARAEPLDLQNADFPGAAPHLAAHYEKKARLQGTLRTTLNRTLQETSTAVVRTAVEHLAGRINSGAAMIVEVSSGDVLAYVGSADFFEGPGGHVDACQSLRSPGSALKPFIYAAAFDAQCLYPSERLLDDTLDLGEYRPENFDEEYNGLITASEALRTSRNIPAVLVTARLGMSQACEALEHAGVHTLTRPPDYYGLGVSLGNCEARLADLMGAYRMLAAGGKYRPLRILKDSPIETEKQVFSEGACLGIQAMLRQPFPEDRLADALTGERNIPQVCYKTGTSTRHRDAWCFVFDANYVIGVWLGNNDGSSAPGLLASEVAIPLAEKIYRLLPSIGLTDPPAPENAFRLVEVCARSGLPVSEYCPQTEQVLLPSSLYLHRRCAVHAARADGPGVSERWPGSTRNWDLAKIDAPLAPVVPLENSGIPTPITKNELLAILSPAPGAEFLLTGGERGDRVKLIASRSATEPMHWYLDDQYLGCSRPDAPLLMPLSLGNHRLACMTNSGETASLHFEVIAPS